MSAGRRTFGAMSQSDATDDIGPEGISDEQLPTDLRPDDNPLAEGLPDNETVGDLLEDGKRPEESEESDSSHQDDGAS